jgi:MFS family permease
MQPAVRFIVCLGLVSLFADITYEGARSLSGPFLAGLGASAAVVGTVGGAGEFIGYGLRYLSGLLADRIRRYWLILFLGYAVNLAAVPLLALVNTWQLAAILLLLERFGKAIRAPARDALLSHAASQTGRGWGFGLHEALDQIGAVTGPLLVAGVLAKQGSYSAAFAMLAIPAACAMVALTSGRLLYPAPADFEPPGQRRDTHSLPPTYWIYTAGAALLAFGFADFALIAFHAKKTALLPDPWIPVLYAAAMGTDAIAALALGAWFDRAPGLPVLFGSILGLLASPLVFWGSLPWVVTGMVLWGASLGAQESVLRAALAEMIPPHRRATAYGIFHGLFGLAWFLGSALLGLLYEGHIAMLVVISVAAQAASIAFFHKSTALK